MPPVPVLPPSVVIKTFQRLGWQVVRQKGSHVSLISKAGLTVEQFLEALNK